MEPHSTKNPLMEMEKSFSPSSLVENHLKPHKRLPQQIQIPNETKKVSRYRLFFNLAFFSLGRHILSTHIIYPIYRELLNVSQYFKVSECVAIFSRRYITDPFDS